jgi:HPt (histidine-containing phosphotransfer) domain-containing protein
MGCRHDLFRPACDTTLMQPFHPPAPAIRAGVLDAQALARLQELDPQGHAGLVPRVLATYSLSLERLLGQFGAARAAGDRDGMRHAAHTLKSSSASVGALELSALCAQVETGLRESDVATLAPVLDQLGVEGARVLSGLRTA